MRRRDPLWASVGAAIATALAGGIAWGAVPGDGRVIHGCYHKTEGQLRVIDPGTDTCRPSEVPIAWNEQGVRGEKGDPGKRAGTAATDMTARVSPSNRKLRATTARRAASRSPRPTAPLTSAMD